MTDRANSWWRMLGPGIVFALTVSGPGDLVTNTAAGATHGYALIWVLGVALAFRYAWLNAAAKYVLVTGESLVAGYARLGRWVVWLLLGALVLTRHLSNLYKTVLMGSAAHLLLPLPSAWSAGIWSIFFTAAAFTLMLRGGYAAIERLCKVLIVLLGAGLVAAAVLAQPDPTLLLRGALIPSIPTSGDAHVTLLILTALIGTEAGSITNLTYTYFVQEKGWHGATHLRRQRVDLLVSVLCLFAMGALLQVIGAATLNGQGKTPADVDDLVRLWSTNLGALGRVMLAAGLLSKVFSGFIGGTAGYASIVTDIARRFAPGFRQADPTVGARLEHDGVYRWSVAFFCFSPLYVLLTPWQPVAIVLVVASVVVVLIPALALGLLRLTNDRQRMGAFRNGWLTNGTLSALVFVSLYFIYQNGVSWWERLAGQ